MATSAYQIEGSPLADDAGPGIWQDFVRQPGRIEDGSTGEVACDHYRRLPDDIALMHDLGVRSYRFSLGWARVLPEGRGRVNQKGLAFYDRLVDQLLARGIAPFATLYHWDLPLALEHRGGWLNDDVAHWFGDFCAILFRAFGDRIPHWVTINEPGVMTEKGRCAQGPGLYSAVTGAYTSQQVIEPGNVRMTITKAGKTFNCNLTGSGTNVPVDFATPPVDVTISCTY